MNIQILYVLKTLLLRRSEKAGITLSIAGEPQLQRDSNFNGKPQTLKYLIYIAEYFT